MLAKLNPEDVGTVIKARKILNAPSLAQDKNIKTICQGYLAIPIVNGPTS